MGDLRPRHAPDDPGAKEVDPVLKLILLQTVLPYVRDCGWGVTDEVAEEFKSLGMLRAEEINWMDPDDPQAELMRRTVARALEKATPPADLKAKVLKKREALFAALFGSARGRGVLLRSGTAWTVRSAEAVAADGSTYWIVASFSGGTGKGLRLIGEAKGGQVVLKDDALADAIEGTLVFIQTSAAR